MRVQLYVKNDSNNNKNDLTSRVFLKNRRKSSVTLGLSKIFNKTPGAQNYKKFFFASLKAQLRKGKAWEKIFAKQQTKDLHLDFIKNF